MSAIPMMRSGQIITFYSYKGGVGRSMALANTAYLLASGSADRRVLLIDWDLEAPGLHEYFRNPTGELSRLADIPDDSPGLIDMFDELRTTPRRGDVPAETETATREMIYGLDFDRYIINTTLANLGIIKAGRFDRSYSQLIKSFDWQKFYNEYPSVFLYFAARLSELFDYVLIDSRAGETDVSGICTRLMPSKLVAVFVTNRQSLTGVVDVITEATTYRKRSADVRPLVVFPLVSRVDNNELELAARWRLADPGQNIPGYQRTFENLCKKIYDLEECDLQSYFDDVQIQHVSYFSYGEQIAALSERGKGRLSLSRSYSSFVERLTSTESPWDDYPGASLLLMHGITEVALLPTEGKNLIVVAGINQTLHFRVFDSLGEKVVDDDETGLADKAHEIGDLKRRLAGRWPPHDLSRTERDRVIAALKAIIGRSHFRPSAHAVDRVNEEMFRAATAASGWTRLASGDSITGLAKSAMYALSVAAAAFAVLTYFGLGSSHFAIGPAKLFVALTLIFLAVILFVSSSDWNFERKLRQLKRLHESGYLSPAEFARLTTAMLERHIRGR
jgi:hypothetical protein